MIYLKHGRIVYDGQTDEGLSLYEADSRLAPAVWFNEPAKVLITELELYGEDGKQRTIFDFGERMRVRMRYRALEPVEWPHFLCAIKRSDQVLCCNFSSSSDKVDLPKILGDGVIEVLTPPLKLVSDRYTILVGVREKNTERLVAGQVGASFHLRHDIYDAEYGVFHEPAEWRVGASVAEEV